MRSKILCSKSVVALRQTMPTDSANFAIALEVVKASMHFARITLIRRGRLVGDFP